MNQSSLLQATDAFLEEVYQHSILDGNGEKSVER